MATESFDLEWQSPKGREKSGASLAIRRSPFNGLLIGTQSEKEKKQRKSPDKARTLSWSDTNWEGKLA